MKFFFNYRKRVFFEFTIIYAIWTNIIDSNFIIYRVFLFIQHIFMKDNILTDTLSRVEVIYCGGIATTPCAMRAYSTRATVRARLTARAFDSSRKFHARQFH